MRLTGAAEEHWTASRRRIDDTTALGKLERPGSNEASGGTARRLVQFLPVFSADGSGGLRRTDRGARAAPG